MNRKENITKIKHLLQKGKLSRYLISKGITPSIADEIAEECGQNASDIVYELQRILSKRIKVAPESADKRKKIALVGPTGVGKTTTVLKLADYYSSILKKKVALVSQDHEKAGSFQQLALYAERWRLPLFSEWQPKIDADLILIDTTGCNFYLPNRVDRIGEALAKCGTAEILLTLSAAGKEVDLYGAIHQFSPLQPSGLIFTKLDETLAAGTLINVSSKTDIPIRYISYGYPLPGEIQVADPYKIMHKILTDLNKEEHQLLRQL